jgi:hypothetical protein
VALFSAGSNGPPPHGWVTSLAFLGALSQSLLAADAFISRTQLRLLYPPPADAPESGAVAAVRLRVAPFAAPLAEGGGAIAGIAGAF